MTARKNAAEIAELLTGTPAQETTASAETGGAAAQPEHAGGHSQPGTEAEFPEQGQMTSTTGSTRTAAGASSAQPIRLNLIFEVRRASDAEARLLAMEQAGGHQGGDLHGWPGGDPGLGAVRQPRPRPPVPAGMPAAPHRAVGAAGRLGGPHLDLRPAGPHPVAAPPAPRQPGRAPRERGDRRALSTTWNRAARNSPTAGTGTPTSCSKIPIPRDGGIADLLGGGQAARTGGSTW